MEAVQIYMAAVLPVFMLSLYATYIITYQYWCSCNMLSNPKQPSCKKVCGPQKGYGEKRCEIQGGGQEMAVMVG